MRIIIPGPPLAKKRARTVRRGTFTTTYDPQMTEKTSVRNEIEAQIKAINPHYVPSKTSHFRLIFNFYLPFPKSSNPYVFCGHLRKDLDNIEKFYSDCLNKIVYHDDVQIIEMSSRKIPSHQPRTEIIIMENKSPDLHPKINKILTLFTKEDAVELDEISHQILKNVHSLTFDADAEVWAKTTAQSLVHLSKKFAKKLAQIKKIGDIAELQEVGENGCFANFPSTPSTPCIINREPELTTC